MKIGIRITPVKQKIRYDLVSTNNEELNVFEGGSKFWMSYFEQLPREYGHTPPGVRIDPLTLSAIIDKSVLVDGFKFMSLMINIPIVKLEF